MKDKNYAFKNRHDFLVALEMITDFMNIQDAVNCRPVQVKVVNNAIAIYYRVEDKVNV